MPKPVIILVDDDPSIRSSLAFSLELEGFAVDAYDSAEALLARGDFPGQGCLVLDYRLAGTDGLALLALLRERGIALPAILITSAPARPLRARIAQADALLIEKPLLGDRLTEAIRKALAQERQSA